MKQISLPLLFVALTLCGCAGSDAPGTTNSPYTGNWSGTWNIASNGQSGTASVYIDNNGVVTGQDVDGSGNIGTIKGQIDNSGGVSGTVQYPNQPASTCRGTFSLNSQQHLVGNLNQYVGQGSYVIAYDLTRQAAQLARPTHGSLNFLGVGSGLVSPWGR